MFFLILVTALFDRIWIQDHFCSCFSNQRLINTNSLIFCCREITLTNVCSNNHNTKVISLILAIWLFQSVAKFLFLQTWLFFNHLIKSQEQRYLFAISLLLIYNGIPRRLQDLTKNADISKNSRLGFAICINIEAFSVQIYLC